MKSMELFRDDKVGFWKLDATDEDRELKPDYIEALPKFLKWARLDIREGA